MYLITGSFTRWLALLYWPTLNILNFGFLNVYLDRHVAGTGVVAGLMLGAAVLWEMLVRSQFGVLQPFLEEIWSRNLGNLFVSPLRPMEYMIGVMLLGLIRLGIGMVFCLIVANLFWGYSLSSLGIPALGFVVNLIVTGWAFGLLLIALLLRFGPSAEWLAWMIAFMLSPFVGVFYPVEILPQWMQTVAWTLPPTYIFEGLRTIVLHRQAPWDDVWKAALLNGVYLIVSAIVFVRTLNAVRRKGGLLQLGTE